MGNELEILQSTDINDIKTVANGRIAEGVEKARKGNVNINPVYDGEYGTVKVFDSDGKKSRFHR